MNLIRLKHLVSTRITTGASESAGDYSADDTRYIRISDFDGNGNIREEVKVSIPNSKAENYLLNENDILIAVTGGTVGKSMIFNLSEKSAYAGYLARIRTNKKLNYKYLWYFLNSPLFEKWRRESINISTIENISAGKYANLPVYYQNIENQLVIVEKLDKSFLKIKQLIYNQQHQIEKLKEYKQSLISKFFNRFVYDLIECKNEISDDASPLHHFCEVVRGNTGFKKDELIEEGEFVGLQYGKIYQTDVVDSLYNYYVDSKFFKENQVVEKGDVILISTSETIEDLGHVCFYNRDKLGLLGGEQFVLKPNQEILNGKFLYYCTIEFSKYIKKYCTGLKVYRFNSTHLKNIYISAPDIDEQKRVVNHLDKKMFEIDSLLNIKETKIKKLIDYKQSLIYEYVTGKKSVV